MNTDTLKIILNEENKAGIKTILKEVNNKDFITIIIELSNIKFIGYSDTSFLIFDIPQDNEFIGMYHVPSEIISMVSNSNNFEIKITLKGLKFIGYNLNGAPLMQLECLKNSNEDYYITDIRKMTTNLNRGSGFMDFPLLKDFEKISKIGENGIAINDGVCYTDGDGFKFYANTDIKLNCLLGTDSMKKIISFSATTKGSKESKLIEVTSIGDQLLCRYGNLLLGVRLFINKKFDDFNQVVKKLPRIFSYELDINYLKSLIGSYKSTNVKDTEIKLNFSKNIYTVTNKIMVGTFDLSCKVIENNDKKENIIKVNFNKFKSLLNAIEFKDNNVSIVCYERFVLITDNTITLLISREG